MERRETVQSSHAFAFFFLYSKMLGQGRQISTPFSVSFCSKKKTTVGDCACELSEQVPASPHSGKPGASVHTGSGYTQGN